MSWLCDTIPTDTSCILTLSRTADRQRRYELCSEYGLFVIDEANVETHGFDGTLHNNEVNPTNDPAWCALCQLAHGTSMLCEVLSSTAMDV